MMTPNKAAARTALEEASSRNGSRVGSAGSAGLAFGAGDSEGKEDNEGRTLVK